MIMSAIWERIRRSTSVLSVGLRVSSRPLPVGSSVQNVAITTLNTVMLLSGRVGI